MTKQKQVILEVLRSTTCHPTADWVYQQARKVLPGISLGTVYRNLNVLKESGEVLELNYGSTFSRYDGNASNHYHFVCTACGGVFDVPLPAEATLDRALEEQGGFRVYYHRTEFYGLCPECITQEGERPAAGRGTASE